MKILLWSPNGAGLHYGGAGTNVYRLYNSNRSSDIQVTLAHANPRQDQYECFTETVCIHHSHSSDYFNLLVYQLKARQWLKKNADRFDVFHGIDIFENTVRPAVYAESIGLPTIVKPAIAGSGLATALGFRKIFRLPEKRRKLVRKLSAIVSISNEITEELLSYGIPSEKIVRIPNGVDTELFHPVSQAEKYELRKILGYHDEDFVILFVGSITPRKQPHWIVDAVTCLLPNYPNVKVCFVGPNDRCGYARNLKDRVMESKYKDSFKFIGHQTQVSTFYQAADLYCLPSKQEGMPNSVLEASASGLPCIVGINSGADEIIVDGDNGFAINSPSQIQDKMSMYLQHPEILQEHGHKGRTHIKRNFSITKVFSQYMNLFQNITGE